MITVGVDEVGRGCWAGPVMAGAVILRAPIAGLKDSKKLSKKERERLAIIIKEEAVAIGLGWVEPGEIDAQGISAAVKRAMELAVEAIRVPFDEVIVDGNISYLAELANGKSWSTTAIIRADDTVPAVSAASIVAKVARDSYMAELAHDYPGYGFASHVGYGTAAHSAALKLHGVTAIHRKSYKPVRALL